MSIVEYENWYSTKHIAPGLNPELYNFEDPTLVSLYLVRISWRTSRIATADEPLIELLSLE